MSKKQKRDGAPEVTITIGNVTLPMKRISEAEWEEWSARRKPAANKPAAPKPAAHNPNVVYTVKVIP